MTLTATIPRLFAVTDASFATQRAIYGELLLPPASPSGRSSLLAELEASGLGGRGGAGFPTWRKLAAMQRGDAVVIANGAEGEPASVKDATLLRTAPHLVLDGLLAAGAAVGATQLIVYATRASLASVRSALAERQDATAVTVHEAPESFLSGQATAAVASIEGRPALPRDHLVRLTTAGLHGRPTLVQNVETLAHVALIARFGAAGFRSIGDPDDAGTRLVSVSRLGAAPVALEVPGGMRVGAVLDAAGIPSPRAVLLGGFHGTWADAGVVDAPLSPAGLAPFGAAPGAGILLALPHGACGLVATAEIVEYLSSVRARQCGPCTNGLPELAREVRAVASGSGSPDRVARLAALVSGRGACAHPDGTARLVASALSVFADDIRRHAAGGCEARA